MKTTKKTTNSKIKNFLCSKGIHNWRSDKIGTLFMPVGDMCHWCGLCRTWIPMTMARDYFYIELED